MITRGAASYYKRAPQVRRNWGYWDGVNAKDMKNPSHNNWIEKGHFDKEYEKGYWKGYNSK